MPNLSISYDPLTQEFLNDANDQPVDPASIDSTDTVTIGADPGGAWAGGFGVTLPANFTCKSLNIQNSCHVTVPSGGTLTADVQISSLVGDPFARLTLGTGGPATTVLNGSVSLPISGSLTTDGPASIQGAGKTVEIGDFASLSVSGGQLNVATGFTFSTAEFAFYEVLSGSTLNIENAPLTNAQVNSLNAKIHDGGTLMYSGPIDITGGSVDFSPPPPVGTTATPIVLAAPALVQNGTVNFGANVSFQSPTLDGITATGEMDVGAGQSATIKDSFSGTVSVKFAGSLVKFSNITDLTQPTFTLGAPGVTTTVQLQGTGAGLSLGQATFVGDTSWTDGTGLSDLILTAPVVLAPQGGSDAVTIHTFKITLLSGNTVTIDAGAQLTTTGIIDNQGQFDIAGGILDFSNILSPSGYGSIAFGSGAAPPQGPQSVPQGRALFTSQAAPQAGAPGGTLEFAKPNATATLVDFNSADAVDILGNFGDTHYHLNLASNVLSVQDKFGDPLGTFTLESTTGVTYDISQFAVTNDSGNGALVTAPGIALCFAAGTRIRTEHGYVAVEQLQVGQRVRTFTDTLRPIQWIGHRRIDLTRHANPEQAAPIRICRDAFAAGVPNRDLLLSPDHAVFADGVLIPVKHLPNGITVTRESGLAEVRYFHIELASHDILLAEDLPVESYLETGARGRFENAVEPLILHPDFASWAWESTACALLVVAGPRLAAVHGKLAERAGRLDTQNRHRLFPAHAMGA